MPAVGPLNKNTKGSRHCHPPTCFPKTQLPLYSSCPELAENLPDDWFFITSLSGKQVPLWFLSWCSSLVKKELAGNTPKTDLFSLKPSFSVVLPGSRQQLSFRDIETRSEFWCTTLTDWLHPLLTSFLGCKLRGCFSHCSEKSRRSTASWMSAPLSRLSPHCPSSWGWFYTWHPPGAHLVMPSFIRVSDTMWAQIASAAGVSWGFHRVEVTGGIESCTLYSATRDSSLRNLWSVKTLSVHRTIIILNVFRKNRKCKRVKFSSPWQNGNGKFHLFHNQNIFYTYAGIFVNITTTNRGE